MSRSLHQIPAGSTVMTDANVLVYALTPQAQRHRSCLQLLERSARGELALQAPVATVADVIHRAMVIELLAQGQAQHSADAVRLLKQRPDLVTGLTRYRSILRDLRQARINIFPLSYRDLHRSRVFREQHGLLANDSLIVAVMQRERTPFLATNDADFERVPGIAVCIPT